VTQAATALKPCLLPDGKNAGATDPSPEKERRTRPVTFPAPAAQVWRNENGEENEMSQNVSSVNPQTFPTEVLNSATPVLVDFSAT